MLPLHLKEVIALASSTSQTAKKMKQLLQCCNQVALAAFNEKAYLIQVLLDTSKLQIELLPPTTEGNESNPPGSNKNPIQAVAIEAEQENSQILWCAVSRLDKTLALYRVNLGEDKVCTSTVSPNLVHILKKRIGCMTFARIPAPPVTKKFDQPHSSLVILGGDFVGDAWAFNVTGKKRETRFLLGHTASMLTGIKASIYALLTSDRDEKIRVSSFPQTVVVNGFLLGHEAYVSSIDIAEASPICVSCSGGDRTVRIWDYERLAALSKWSENRKLESNDKDQDEIKTPARVAIDKNARYVAVIYDQCKTMHILRITDEKSLRLSQVIECSDQVLSVEFCMDDKLLVSMKDPSYIQAYATNNSTTEVQFQPTEFSGLVALRRAAEEASIIISDSALEKDKHGMPTLQKITESRTTTPLELQQWNNPDRVNVAKERNKRHQKRRKLAGKS